MCPVAVAGTGQVDAVPVFVTKTVDARYGFTGNANVERVKQMLVEHELVPEEWGGDTVCVEVSAKKRINIDGLLEMVLLVADMKELKANPNKPARGTVIEAQVDRGRGPVATVLVQEGTLKVGDIVIAGTAAEGETDIYNLEHIDRGYENIEEKFRKIGANIKRVTE